MTAWSYSRVNTFKQCPKKYYHLNVKKDVKDTGSAATRYGGRVHRAAEKYIKEGKPLDREYNFMQGTLDVLNKIEGEKHCELRLGVSKEDDGYIPTSFWSKEVWYRGIADLVIIDGDTAFSVDYKTSKSTRYADTKQLDLIAGALFITFPQLKKIKSALSFVVCKGFVTKEHTVDLYKSYINVFDEELERIEVALENNVWNAVDGPLCGFCPVISCEHNRR
tara:strand:- start:702 stop:1364 length:663 start_codon:yes stop_codon:yes gene_type:complete